MADNSVSKYVNLENLTYYNEQLTSMVDNKLNALRENLYPNKGQNVL